jgi:hypothetical protein
MSTAIEDRIAALEGRVAQLEKPRAAAPRPAAPAPAGIVAATDAECLGQYGDPEIRKDPPRWTGESFAGRRFSQTSPEYLDNLASFKMWSANKDDAEGAVDSQDRPKSHWAKKDAALALGWARRLRAGLTVEAPSRYGTTGHGASAKHAVTPDDSFGDSEADIPF